MIQVVEKRRVIRVTTMWNDNDDDDDDDEIHALGVENLAVYDKLKNHNA